MNQLVFVLLFALAGFLLGFGDNGRGYWSKSISIAAGLIWLSAVVAEFAMHGLKVGLLALLASFVIAGITMRIGAWTILKMRGRK